MLQHGLAVGVGAHLEDIEIVVFTVGAPVVLGRLDGSVHLIQPGTDQRRILGNSGNHAAAAVKARGEGAILGGNVTDIRSQSGQGFPAVQSCDVCNVPGEADAVTSGLTLGNVGGPFLGEGFGVNQALGVQVMEPGNALLEALCVGNADDFLVVRYRDVTTTVGIAVAFTETVDQDAGILVAVVQDAGHGDDVAFNAKVSLQISRIVTESNQHSLKLVNGSGHFQIQIVQPCGVDEAHVAHGLDSGLFIAQLFDPGECPDVAILVGTHCLVLGSLLKDLVEVGHILLDVVFQIDDDTLLRILQQIGITETGIEHEVRQGLDVGHLQCDFLTPLVALDGLPLHMDVGLLFQTLEDGTVVRLGLGAGGEVGQALDGCGFGQRELEGSGVHFQAGGIAAHGTLAAAASKQR